MNFPSICSTLLCLLCLSPSITFAGVNKCTDASGKVSYSDQPCSNKEGEKPAEIKNTAAFAAIATRENEKKLAQGCIALTERRSQCHYALESQLDALLIGNCEGPIKRDRLDKQRDQRLEQRNNRYSRAERDETDEEKTEVKIECGELPFTVWRFVKDNFGSKLSEKEIKEIEYKLLAVPSDGREPLFAKRKKKY